MSGDREAGLSLVEPSRHIAPLTSFRFFAAMMVVAHHYWGFAAGMSGVTFFFVLSGYVLAINYADRVSTPTERRLFWWKRFARIYPTHALTFLLALPVGGSAASGVANLLLLQSWVPSGNVYFGFNMPSWSISDEAAFYAIFPFLLVALRNKPWQKLMWWAIAISALSVAWEILLPDWDFKTGTSNVLGMPDVAWTHFVFYIFPPVRLLEFALGIGIALVPSRRSFGTAWEVFALALAIASLACFYLEIPPSIVASLLFVPSAIIVIRVFSSGSGLISKLISNRILVLLGEASFMLYMIHWLLLNYRFASGTVTAAVALALSVGLHMAFERPIQSWLLNRPFVSRLSAKPA